MTEPRHSARMRRLDEHLAKVSTAIQPVPAPQVRVEGPGVEYVSGSEVPFHGASAGKLVTTALIGRLIDDGTIGPHSRIASLLPEEDTRGLFVHKGIDRLGEVTVDHLLAHTSGVADYFEGPARGVATVEKQAVSQPDRTWTPREMLAHSRDHQTPVAAPGRKFSYSDTGYILLGRIIEEAYGAALHDAARERVFAPLGMTRSWYAARSQPIEGDTVIEPLWLGPHEVSTTNALSVDWAGGGVAATAADWIRLSRGLWDGSLLRPDTARAICARRNTFRMGIGYGAGAMVLNLRTLAPFMRSLPTVANGHLGITSVHVWHFAETDTHVVMNFHDTRLMRRSFVTLTALPL